MKHRRTGKRGRKKPKTGSIKQNMTKEELTRKTKAMTVPQVASHNTNWYSTIFTTTYDFLYFKN